VRDSTLAVGSPCCARTAHTAQLHEHLSHFLHVSVYQHACCTPPLRVSAGPMRLHTGYGSHAIGDCWIPAWLVGMQCILAVLLEAIFLGIIFAKISHPKGRSRTIVISECACIARRDGILKL
jgi:hypothetical protein